MEEKRAAFGDETSSGSIIILAHLKMQNLVIESHGKNVDNLETSSSSEFWGHYHPRNSGNIIILADLKMQNLVMESHGKNADESDKGG